MAHLPTPKQSQGRGLESNRMLCEFSNDELPALQAFISRFLLEESVSTDYWEVENDFDEEHEMATMAAFLREPFSRLLRYMIEGKKDDKQQTPSMDLGRSGIDVGGTRLLQQAGRFEYDRRFVIGFERRFGYGRGW